MSLTLSEDLPLIAVAVDSRSRIEPLVEPTARLTGTGLVTLERARLLRGDDSTGDTRRRSTTCAMRCTRRPS